MSVDELFKFSTAVGTAGTPAGFATISTTATATAIVTITTSTVAATTAAIIIGLTWCL
jgi:hypothetical protein